MKYSFLLLFFTSYIISFGNTTEKPTQYNKKSKKIDLKETNDGKKNAETNNFLVSNENNSIDEIGSFLSVPHSILDRIKFDAGEEDYIYAGSSTTIIPYYASLKYLLDPYQKFSPFYIVKIGINYVDDEDISKLLDELSQRFNYGIGVGVEYNNLVFGLLYGKYSYSTLIPSHLSDKDITKLTFSWKYKF